MASTDLIEFMKTWELDDQESERKRAKIIEKGLDEVTERESPLVARMKVGSNVQTQKVQWMEERAYELILTGTLTGTSLVFSGYLLGAAITSDALKQHVKVNSVLYRDSDGMQCKVSSMDYSNLTATVAAHGNNTLSNDSSAVSYRLLLAASSDYDDTYVPNSLDRRFRFCGTQIFKEYVELPHSRRDLKMEIIADEWAHQVKKVVDKIAQQRAAALILMEPPYSGGSYVTGYETENPAITGIFAWPKIVQAELANTDVYVDNSASGTAVPLDVDALNALVMAMEDDEKVNFNRGDWVIAMHGVTHQYISDEFVGAREFSMEKKEVGYEVTAFHSKRGKTFPILRDNYVPASKIAILDISDCRWGWYGKQNIRTKLLAESYENVDIVKITGQIYGVVKRKPREIGVIYGLPTTYSS